MKYLTIKMSKELSLLKRKEKLTWHLAHLMCALKNENLIFSYIWLGENESYNVPRRKIWLFLSRNKILKLFKGIHFQIPEEATVYSVLEPKLWMVWGTCCLEHFSFNHRWTRPRPHLAFPHHKQLLIWSADNGRTANLDSAKSARMYAIIFSSVQYS